MPDILFSPDYIVWFSDLKQRVGRALTNFSHIDTKQ